MNRGGRLLCRSALLIGLILFVAGCATPDARWQPSTAPAEVDVDVRECRQRLSALPGPGELADDTVWYRPPAQPWFAIDRLHASFAVDTLDPAAFIAWRQGVETRSRGDLAAWLLRERGNVSTETLDCLQRLAEATPQAVWAAYAEEAASYSHYRHWQRLLGFYPAIAPLVAWRIRSLQRDWAANYGELPDAPLTVYSPRGWSTRPAVPDGSIAAATVIEPLPDPDTVSRWLAAAREDDPLGLPRLDADQLATLLALHAPDWVTTTNDPAGQPGRIVADNGQPQLDQSEPVIYLDHGFARLDSGAHLQLLYAIWFAERPPTRRLDLYSGTWNGVIWRVTLDHDGQPLWYDSLHHCGCYHQVWLGPGQQPSPARGLESPLYLPIDWQGRPRLLLAPGSHHILAVTSADQPLHARPITATHAMQPAHQHALLTIVDPAKSTGYSSFYRPDGLVGDSHRLERWVLWPFGIQAPGTMRRPGSHAIAFVGQRHFDDPQLFDALIEREPSNQW